MGDALFTGFKVKIYWGMSKKYVKSVMVALASHSFSYDRFVLLSTWYSNTAEGNAISYLYIVKSYLSNSLRYVDTDIS